MQTKMVQINQKYPEKWLIEEAGSIILSGGLVAFPTETVYGLGGNGLDGGASRKIYQAKGRPSDNPLIIHISDMNSLAAITNGVPQKAKDLARVFWPGPLTMIFSKSDRVPYETTGGLGSVAVRMPDHAIALALIEAGGGYVAAPSANRSGRPSPTMAGHVMEDMDGSIDMIIDGGMVGIGLESTIIDFTEAIPVILRPGYINQEMIEAVIGEVQTENDLYIKEESARPKAPGMKYRHYAPQAELTIVEGNIDEVVHRINVLCEQRKEQGARVGVIGTEETVSFYRADVVKNIGTRIREEGIGLHLFGILREFDELKVDYIYSESFYTPHMGQAIMNRLLKAAGHRMIHV